MTVLPIIRNLGGGGLLKNQAEMTLSKLAVTTQAETTHGRNDSGPKRLAEMIQGRNDSGPKRPGTT